MMEAINKLIELTNRLPDRLDALPISDSVVEYQMDGDGIAYGRGLLKNELISVQEMTAGGDNETVWHIHNSREFFIVFKGSVILETIEGDCIESHILKVGDFFVLDAGAKHKLKTSGLAKILVIGVPPINEFPDDGFKRK